MIEELATKIMGWKKETFTRSYGGVDVENVGWKDKNTIQQGWNPLEDWNDCNMMEERIMEDGRGKICKKYLAYFTSKQQYMASSCRERCIAALKAYE